MADREGLRARAAQRAPSGEAPRRESQWQQAKVKTLASAKTAAKGVGRWFGVTGDQQAVQAMHLEYMRQKTLGKLKTKKHGPALTENQLAQATNMLAESSSSESSDDEIMRVKHMTRDVDKAMKHYQDLWVTDKKGLAKPGWFGNQVKAWTVQWGSTLNAGPAKRKHTYLRDETFVAMQLQSLPTFTPWFIYITSLLQLLIFVGMMAHAQTKHFIAPMGLSTTVTTCTFNVDCPVGFDGLTQVNGTQKYVEHNYLYGPTTSYLISVGAKFTACMRADTEADIYYASVRASECGVAPTPCLNSNYTGFSCCALPSGRKGMTTNATCLASGGTWIYGSAHLCDANNDFIVLRPCCGARHNVKCQLVTKEECSYMGGEWQETAQLCSQSLCLAPICKLLRGGYGITSSATYANQPSPPNQWFRFITPLYLHAGIIQAFVFLCCQMYFGTTIEKQAGFIRTFCIYFISGIGGYVVGGIFAPSSASVGCDPAVYGFLAVHLIELLQNWQIVLRPWWELSKLMFIILAALMIGTLPYIDNWSHVGGFIFGLFAGIVFLPYINFGQWDLTRKRVMLMIALPCLVVLLILAFVYFYKVQTTHFCSWCKWVDCVPYTSAIDCGDQ